MTFILHGTGVSSGIAIGRAQLLSHATLEVAHYTIPKSSVPFEILRLSTAIEEVRHELEELHRSMTGVEAPAEFGAFLDVHWMILNDPTLAEAPKVIIEQQLCNAEWALTQQMHVLVEQFEHIEDAYLRERSTDVVNVVERVLKVLLGTPGRVAPTNPEQKTILVAHDLSPADVIQLKQHHFAGFLTDIGGVTSHTAIVARSLNIPSVVALHHARGTIRENELLIVDGSNAIVIVNPDKAVLAEYRLKQHEIELERQKLKRLRTTRATTLDGCAVELHANIELPGDLGQVIEAGANGVGLFRSEFLFLNRAGLPSEEEQFEAYRVVAEGLEGKPVTIRTFDLGADKSKEGLGGLNRVSQNPALGLRAVRFCLAEPKLFLTQLRAILRASNYGNVRILIPMLSSSQELEQALLAIVQAKRTLDDQGIPYNRDIKIGGMIEVPAAVLAISIFLDKLDFLSIGTNDLIQYTLAIDRSDDAVSHLYDPLHPAILRLLGLAIRAANKQNVPIALCGEMAGEVRLTRLLLGMGLRNFSMHPAHVLTVKQRILTSNMPDIQDTTARILKSDDSVKIRTWVDKLNS